MATKHAEMVAFLKRFAETLDAAGSAEEVGIDLSEAEAQFARSRNYRARLQKLFAQQNSLYDAVPLSAVRTLVLQILATRKAAARDRIAAARLLLELVTGPETGRETMGELLKAIARGQEQE